MPIHRDRPGAMIERRAPAGLLPHPAPQDLRTTAGMAGACPGAGVPGVGSAARTLAVGESGLAAQKRRVLIIGPDPMVHSELGGALRDAGFEVSTAADGAAGVAAATEITPDLIILDTLMPELDGYQTCQAIRRLPRLVDVPVLMLTGCGDLPSLDQAFDAGATDFLAKPISPAMLCYRVCFMLRASETLGQLMRSEAQLAEAQRVARLGHWEVNLATEEFIASSQVFAMLGIEPGAAVHLKDYIARVHPEDQKQFGALLAAALRGQQPLEHRHRVAGAGSSVLHVEIRGAVVRDAGNRPMCLCGTMRDVSGEVQSEERVRRLASHDDLTGLPNRSMFIKHLAEILYQARRRRRMVAVMLLGLDDLGQINDTLGYKTGDLVLVETGRRLREILRGQEAVGRSDNVMSSEVARWGDDKFPIVITDLASGEDAAGIAARLLEALGAPMAPAGREIFLSGTIGISLFPRDATEPAGLLQHADIALHRAKEAGRGTFAFFDRSMNEASRSRLLLEGELRRAIASDQIAVHYQPLVDGETGRIVGVEALARWFHPQLGVVSPTQFVPIAERIGLVGKLAARTVERTCACLDQWAAAGLPQIYAAVNLSARQFRNRNLAAGIRAQVQAAGRSPQDFMLEITESILMEDLEAGERTLAELKSHGFRMAIDDFGTGYSSLTYLKRFPIDVLKIDRAFVQGVHASDRDAVLLAGIVGLARGLGVEPVAEGVETIQQRNVLVACGCTMMQGYLFARPMPGEDVAALLASGGGKIEVDAAATQAQAKAA